MHCLKGFMIGIDTMAAITILGTALVYFMYIYGTGVQSSSSSAIGTLNYLDANSKLQELILLKYGNRISNASFINVSESAGYALSLMNFSAGGAGGTARPGRLIVLDGRVYSISGR